MTGLWKIVILALTGVFGAAVIKKGESALAQAMTVAVAVVVLFLTLGALEPVVAFFHELSAMSGLDTGLFSPVIKTVGIGIVTKIAAELCRDAHEGGVAATVELAGTAIALYVALPLLTSVMRLIVQMI